MIWCTTWRIFQIFLLSCNYRYLFTPLPVRIPHNGNTFRNKNSGCSKDLFCFFSWGGCPEHKPIDLENISHETLGNIHPLFDSSVYQIYPDRTSRKKKIVFGRRCQQGLLQASWWWSTIPPKKTQRKAGIWKSEVLMKGRFWNWKPSFLLFILKCWWSILFFIFFSGRIPRFQTRQSPCWVCSKEVLPILECQKNLHKVL